MHKVKVGVFGGRRGAAFIHHALHDPFAELVAICDLDEGVLNSVRENAVNAGMEHVAFYKSFDDFIQHDMDAVIVANFANEHVPYAIRLMESGRHVLSECLTCATMKEAVELIECVERTGMVYAYAENHCFTPVRMEMRKRYRRGDIGELMYAEGEYIHDCSALWPSITYGLRDHWRNQMASTFYCTHSIGPVLHMTGLRPVQVSAFEARNMPYMRELGSSSGTFAMEIITLENGAFMKSLHFNMKHTRHSNYQLNGDLGAMVDLTDGQISVYTEQPGQHGNGKREVYTPELLVADDVNSGQKGYTTNCFTRYLLGDEEAKESVIDVYTAVDMCIPGTLGYVSIAEGNKPIKIPNLRNKEERDAYRNDTRCTFPKIAGDQLIPNNLYGDPEIPDEVYEKVKKMYLNK